jgi:hypothetical protein
MSFKRRYHQCQDEGIDSFVLVTVSGSATFNNIPNGTYVDAVTGDTINVSGGSLTANVSGQGNARVYVLGYHQRLPLLEKSATALTGSSKADYISDRVL